MKKIRVKIGVILALVGASDFFPSATNLTAAPDKAGRERVVQTIGKLPLRFEANAGQTDAKVQFVARGAGYSLFLAHGEAVFVLRRQANHPDRARPVADKTQSEQSTVLRIKFVGADAKSQPEGLEELPSKANYFIGRKPQNWRTAVASYAKVRYPEVYPGIDLVYYGNQRQLEHDLVVAPGADPCLIEWQYAGAEDVRLEGGELVIETRGGEVRQRAPLLYQKSAEGRRQEIAGHYALRGKGKVGIEVGDHDPTRELVIDPVLAYSTYLGGNDPFDNGFGIAIDTAGNAYVTGDTDSTDFPGANQFQLDQPKTDAFVAKLNTNASGAASLVYSTYLGGGDFDRGKAIAVDADGNAYVTGFTNSTDFPLLNPFQGSQGGVNSEDIFVTKLNTKASGAASLVYSTYLGGNGDDEGTSIAVDSAGNIYVTGSTDSTDFPLAKQFQSDQPGVDAFVTKLNPKASGAASLAYSTYLGGNGTFEVGTGIALDTSGYVYVTGTTDSTDFPLVNQFQGKMPGDDVFVTKLNTNANGISSVFYSTYLGGSGDDESHAIAVDASANAYVTGETSSTDFLWLTSFRAINLSLMLS